MFTLLLITSALATECIPTALRPFGLRLHLWDLTEGPIQPWEHLASQRRIEEISRLKSSTMSSIESSDAVTDARIRLADLYTAEGRFQVRCAPDSGRAEPWLTLALDILEITQKTSPSPLSENIHFLRSRVDASCGLAYWKECLSTVEILASHIDSWSLSCEKLVWLGESALDQGDLNAAIRTFKLAPEAANAPECTYALYGRARGQLMSGFNGEAIWTLSQLAEREALHVQGPPGSVGLEAAVLDMSDLGHNHLQAREELARIAPIIVVALNTPLREHPRAIENPTIASKVIRSLISMTLFESALQQIEAFDRQFCHHGPWLRARIRRSHALYSTQAVLKELLAYFLVSFDSASSSAQSTDKVPDDALRCRAIKMYLALFLDGAYVPPLYPQFDHNTQCLDVAP